MSNRSALSGTVLQIATLLTVGFPVFLFYSFLTTLVYLIRIKLHFCKPSETIVGPYHEGKMFEIQQLSTEEQKDFKRNRSSSYINQLTFGCLWEFSKFIGRKQTVPLIEDDVLMHSLLNTVFCHGLVKEENDPSISYRLPFNLRNYKVFPGFYWDVKEIWILENNTLSILDSADNIHTPNSPKWDLAKAHAQAQLTFFAPGLAHNHVHFVFPTLMATFVREKLPETSVLRQLIEPHTRFTQYINYKALNECQSSNNTGSFVDRWFRPWLSFPIDNDDFLNGIQENCEKFYYDNQKLTQTLDEDLPYHQFLKKYYEVVDQLVTDFLPLIKDDFEILSSSISEYLPTVRTHNAHDVITTLIWNCAVVHFCDHHSYLKLFANKYGCMAIRTPLVTEAGFEHENDEKECAIVDGEKCSLFVSEDIYRTKCFLRTFVQYNETAHLDLSLINTKYNFKERTAVDFSKKFFENLKKLNESLHEDGTDIIELSEMVRTVSF